MTEDEMAGSHHQLNDSCAVLCLVTFSSLRLCGLYCARLPCPWGVSRQEYLRGLPCPPPGNLPNPGIKSRSPTLQVILYQLSHQGSPRILEWVEFSSVQFSRSVTSDSLRLHGLQHARPPCPSPTPRAYLNSCPLNW